MVKQSAVSGLVKVLHVVNSLDPGGMENGVVNLACGLEPRGIATYVACLERRGAFAERLPDSAHVEVLEKCGGFSRDATIRLARHISRVQPDVIHTHNLGPLIYASLATIFGFRRPIVHGEHSQLTPEELKPRRLRQRRWLYRACRQVHTVAEGIRGELISLGFSGHKIRTITNGVDTARFIPADRPAIRRELALPPDALFIGIVGRFGPFKGHDVLLAAFEKIALQFPAARLLIVGAGGPEEARIAALAAQSLHRERIHLAGFQSDPVRWTQALDLLAIPSTNEGMSNAALEAMACAVPVLANTGCGQEHLIDQGRDGFIADLRTPGALATELAALIENPGRLVDIGTNARSKVVSHFSLRAMIDAYEQLYRAL